MEFTKMHGIGNDFVLVNCMNKEPDFKPSRVAQMVCDRHFGIGADGLMLVCPSKVADFQMKLWNSDGSVAEMCGNGIRCFAKYVYDRGFTDKKKFTVETLDGIKTVSLETSGSGKGVNISGADAKDARGSKANFVSIGMGEPTILSNGLDTPLGKLLGATDIDLVEKITVKGQTLRMVFMNLGVPHTVIFASDLEEVPFYELGPVIECHKRFPNKTNVNFVQVNSRDDIKVRVWERGAGETLACGTGASASATAAYLLGLVDRDVQVRLPGGTLKININEDGSVLMSGPATEVFRGNMEV